ncbi:HAD-IC family P-type ATPase, partial [Streptomyces sp. NPDC059506]|uniref:cation-translocating P-type ATPase n=1 Tax=Streptomyces sp. NPDC059506 TaxID=3347751 RepID=UPI0036B5C1D6
MLWSSLARTVSRAAAAAAASAPALLHGLGGAVETHWLRRDPDGVRVGLRRLGGPGTSNSSRALEARLGTVPGVARAEVNGTLGCVRVFCDPDRTDTERLVSLVAEADAGAEKAWTARRDGTEGEGAEGEGAEGEGAEGEGQGGAEGEGAGGPGGGPERPARAGSTGAPEEQLGAALRVVASAAATVTAVTGRAARLPRLHPLVPALVQLVETVPTLGGAARRVGAVTGSAAWSAASLAVTTLTFQPFSTAVATVLACNRYSEVRARARAWREWDERLGRRPGAYRHDAAPACERPVPLPLGPGERYGRTAVPAALAAYGSGGFLARSHNRAVGLLIAGTPRAFLLGREAFAAAVGRAACGRGALVLRPDALRRLDRLDTVVLDARVLVTGSWTPTAVLPLAPRGRSAAGAPADRPDGAPADDPQDGTRPDGASPHGASPDGAPCTDEIHARVHELADGFVPGRPRTRGVWRLSPLPGPGGPVPEGAPEEAVPGEAVPEEAVPGETVADEAVPGEAAAWAGERRGQGAEAVLVSRAGRPVAVAVLVPELRPAAGHLVRAARECGRVLLAGGPLGLVARLGADGAVPVGRARVSAAVRALQADGHGVVLVTARARRALVRADLGIGVVARAGRVPWDADVAGPPDVAHLLLSSSAGARALSLRCARFGAFGAALGALAALTAGRPRTALARTRLVADCTTLAAITAAERAGRALAARPMPPPSERAPWHAMTVRHVMARLETSPAGLDGAEAARRRRFAGRERRAGAASLLGRVGEELANPLTPVLAVGGGVSAWFGSLVDAVLIVGVLGGDALLGGTQRFRADRAAERLTETAAPRVRLRRADGDAETETTADRLVPGDVVELRAGDAVPADCRVLRAVGVEVDEAGLTGESQPVAKAPAPTSAAALADRCSMLYEGTTMAAGTALAVVVATGPDTEAGAAGRAAPGEGPPVTGVERRLRSLGRWFLPLSVASGAVLLLSGLARRQPLGAAVGAAVSLCVAAVPEGLPFVATAAELAAARRLSARSTLVRRPSTIEALGRVDVLCIDKTGTLTEGRISLQQVSDGRERRPLDGLTPALRRVVKAAARACPAGPSRSLAHPTDRAVVAGAERLGAAPDDRAPRGGADGWERLGELPFEPGRGYHAVLGRDGSGVRTVAKGAPEVLLAHCDRILRDGTVLPFDAGLREEVHRETDRLARSGLRVLAVAESTGGEGAGGEPVVSGLCLLGLLGLADPVRATAAESIGRLAAAGVRSVMLTGDHPSTAEAVARELGLLDGRRTATGPELDALDDEALTGVLPHVAVFARVTPAHKVRIATALRAAGRVVAMTGDGANDAPAIRSADVGIAVGARATPAARAAADVVVTDDRIETVVDAVVEGRSMWASVRKALGILLGGNLGEIAFTLASGLFTGGSALNARQLLLVNLLTDMLPAMAVAARPPSGDTGKLLREGPEVSLGRPLTRHIRRRALLTAGAASTAWLLARPTGTRARAGTVALVALVGSQLLQTLVDSGRDPVATAAALGSLAVLALVVGLPGVSHFFGCRPLGPAGWTIGLAAAGGGARLPPGGRRGSGHVPTVHPSLNCTTP